MSVLDVTDLKVSYATARVLDGVSLSVAEGETVALLGRNGMGKTTLVRALCGLTPPTVTSGSIRLDGIDIVGVLPQRIARAGVGLVPQGRRIFGSLTVEENLAVVGKRRPPEGSWTTARVYDFFPRLKERVGSLARNLSGGEQQMLAIGRALMTNPRLLIMDEPSEGLAPAVLDVIEDRLQELRQTGLAVLVAEQNVDLALSLSDRVYILGDHGKLGWSGSSADLVADPGVISKHLGL
jgi:branched-chain amino acid transport system ATP-binding protein